jgi:hypothetical protein
VAPLLDKAGDDDLCHDEDPLLDRHFLLVVYLLVVETIFCLARRLCLKVEAVEMPLLFE